MFSQTPPVNIHVNSPDVHHVHVIRDKSGRPGFYTAREPGQTPDGSVLVRIANVGDGVGYVMDGPSLPGRTFFVRHCDGLQPVFFDPKEGVFEITTVEI